jgi:uncharacterized protein YbbK (DUF523 family)
MVLPKIGVSACILGQEVRYDGGHQLDSFVVNELSQRAELVPICPEVEIGLGVPREVITLVQLDDGIHLVATETRRDITDHMHAYCQQRLDQLEAENLSGFILMQKSPSCGKQNVKVWHGEEFAREGVGLFAEALMKRFPTMPVEEIASLSALTQREVFIERVLTFQRGKIR